MVVVALMLVEVAAVGALDWWPTASHGVRLAGRGRGRRPLRSGGKGHRPGRRRGELPAVFDECVGAALVGRAERVVGGAGKVAGGGVTLGWILGHSAGDHLIESCWEGRVLAAGPGNGPGQMGGHERGQALYGVPLEAGEALVEHTGQRVDIGAVGDLRIAEPFGRHVAPTTHGGTGSGEVLVVGERRGDAEVDEIGEVVVVDRMFSGLMSRWMTPARWAASRASATCPMMATARGGGNAPSRRISAPTLVPSTKRMSMNSWPPISP